MAKKKASRKKAASGRTGRAKKASVSDTARVKKSLIEIRNDVEEVLASLEAHPVAGPFGRFPVIFFDIGDTLLVQESEHWVWAPSAQETVKLLASRGVRLGLISNTPDGATQSTLQPLFPDGFFDSFRDDLVILSSVVGIEKPDLRIFLHAAVMARCKPARCAFVGENLAETLAAQSIGMRAVRIKDFDADFAHLRSL